MSHWEWVKVREIRSVGDGRDVEVHEMRCPAVFTKVVALGTETGAGRLDDGFALESGSGMERLMGEVANAIALGMLTLSDGRDG